MGRGVDTSIQQSNSGRKSSIDGLRYNHPDEFDEALNRLAFNLLLWADVAEASRDYGAAVGDISVDEYDLYDKQVVTYRAAAAALNAVIHFND